MSTEQKQRAIFSKNLRRIMKARQKTQSDLVIELCLNKATVSTWCSGKKMPRMGTIQKLANYFGVNKSDLIEDLEESPDNILPIRFKKIPLLGEIAAGEPIFADQEYGAYVTADEDLNADFALRVRGDSMYPKILDGDTVFIRKQATVENGQIAAVIIEDDATLKRVYINEDTITLISENADYAPFSYRIGEENIRILGRAVALTRKV